MNCSATFINGKASFNKRGSSFKKVVPGITNGMGPVKKRKPDVRKRNFCFTNGILSFLKWIQHFSKREATFQEVI